MAILRPLEKAFFEGSTSGPDICAKCTMPIRWRQAEWNWTFPGHQVRMHTDCALVWIDSLRDDLEKLEELEEDINDD